MEEVERFSKRTISVCLSQAEQESDLPSLAEVSSYEPIDDQDDSEVDEECRSTANDADRSGDQKRHSDG